MTIGSQSETSPTFATVSVAITAAQVADLMVTFIESGDPVTMGWCGGVFLETGGSSGVEPGGLWYSKPELYAADDWMIRVLEDEDETGDPEQCKAHLISRKEFLAGLAKLATSGDYSHHLNDIVRNEGDAATADIAMQFVLFGKEVYA